MEVREAREIAELDVGLTGDWRIGAVSVGCAGADLGVGHESGRGTGGRGDGAELLHGGVGSGVAGIVPTDGDISRKRIAGDSR